MKKKNFIKVGSICVFALLIIFNSCKSDDSTPVATPSEFQSSTNELVFDSTIMGEVSQSLTTVLTSSNITNDVTVTVTSNFEVSKNNTDFLNTLSLTSQELNTGTFSLYVRFTPEIPNIGTINGDLLFTSDDFSDVTVNLSGISLEIPREIQVIGAVTDFGDVMVATASTEQVFQVKGLSLENDVTATVTGAYEISKDNVTYTDVANYTFGTINTVEENLYVRFIPALADLGVQNGNITLSATGVDDVVIALSGTGTAVAHNYVAFNQEALGFGGGFSQSAVQNFTLHPDLTNIAQIKMFVQIDCPATGCDDWDRFANVKIKDVSTGDWYELGRYITPYWTGTQQLARGLEFDVTDFKSLLTGTVELRIYIENWTAKADLITVDFDFIEGTPDYEYYEVAGVLQYNANSIDGVPYGEAHAFDLDKSITIPANAESTYLRSVISGWGHATGSPGSNCAEWCFKTHDVKINGTNTFEHYMGPLGCSSNPISNQSPGNWMPNRAGWCPGMGVPTRIDTFATSMAGSMFTFEYDYEDWTNNMGNGNAYYATSTYVVVKSSTPITKPTVN